jgi:hypothetical protein
LLPAIGKDPSLLHHFIYETMVFDDNVRSTFGYDGGNIKLGWPGLTSELMEDWFQIWFDIEKKFAMERFQTILDNPESGKLDYDSSGPRETRPTVGAQLVEELLSSTTKLYKRLYGFDYKVRFLLHIQVTILDLYHNRLSDSLDAYQSITSTVGRTIHGHTKEEQQAMEGTGGLESLCKVYGSAEYLINTLRDWSNDVVCLHILID